MKLFALVLLVGVASAARLDNTYLPPSNARTAGGQGSFLGAPSGEYGAPNNQQYQNGVTQARQSQFPQTNAQETYGSPSHSNALTTSYGSPLRSAQPSPVYGPANGASSRSNSADVHANTLRYDNQKEGNGNYRFEFETENRISQQELGQLKSVGDGEATVVQGSYSYAGDDGKTYTVNYVADENGFQPSGEHIDQAITKAASEAGRSGNGGYQYQKGQSGYNYNAPQQGYQRSQGYQQSGHQEGQQDFQQGQLGYQGQQGFQQEQQGYQPGHQGFQQGQQGQQGFQQGHQGQQGFQQGQQGYQQGQQGYQQGHQAQQGYQRQQRYKPQQGFHGSNGQPFEGQRQASNGGYQY